MRKRAETCGNGGHSGDVVARDDVAVGAVAVDAAAAAAAADKGVEAVVHVAVMTAGALAARKGGWAGLEMQEAVRN
jgi:hypothetical protein